MSGGWQCTVLHFVVVVVLLCCCPCTLLHHFCAKLLHCCRLCGGCATALTAAEVHPARSTCCLTHTTPFRHPAHPSVCSFTDLGMQKILPDTSFLAQWRDKIEAVVITHGRVLRCAGLCCVGTAGGQLHWSLPCWAQRDLGARAGLAGRAADAFSCPRPLLVVLQARGPHWRAAVGGARAGPLHTHLRRRLPHAAHQAPPAGERRWHWSRGSGTAAP